MCYVLSEMGHNTTRAREFDAERASELFERMAAGETITSICRDQHMPNQSTIWEWQRGNLGAETSWREDYARARLTQADAFARAVIDLADSVDPIAHAAGVDALNNLDEDATPTEKRRTYFYAQKRSIEGTKMAIDARKWVAARMAPHRWGDRVTIENIGDGKIPVLLDMSKLTTVELEQLAVIQKGLTPGATETIEITADSSVETPTEKTKSAYTKGWKIPGGGRAREVSNAAATG